MRMQEASAIHERSKVLQERRKFYAFLIIFHLAASQAFPMTGNLGRRATHSCC